MKIRNKEFIHSFVVFPQDTNYMPPMVFGGKVMAEMDIAAAMAVRRALIDSPAKDAVTTRVNDVCFHIGACVGDLIFLKAEIVKLGKTSLTIKVSGERELKNGSRESICEGVFTFVSVIFENEREFNKIPHELEF